MDLCRCIQFALRLGGDIQDTSHVPNRELYSLFETKLVQLIYPITSSQAVATHPIAECHTPLEARWFDGIKLWYPSLRTPLCHFSSLEAIWLWVNVYRSPTSTLLQRVIETICTSSTLRNFYKSIANGALLRSSQTHARHRMMVRLFLIHACGTDGMARSAEVEMLAVLWLTSTVSKTWKTQSANSELQMNEKRRLRMPFT